MHRRLLAAFVLLFMTSGWLAAHDPGLSTLQAVVEPSGQVELTFTFAQPDLRAALSLQRDARLPQNLDFSEGGSQGAASVPSTGISQQELSRLAEGLVQLDSGPSEGPPPTVRLLQAESHAAEDGRNVVFRLALHGTTSRHLNFRVPLLERLPRGHRLFATSFNASGEQTSAALLYAGNDRAQLPLDGAEEDSSGGAWHFLALGIEHIVTGYDHLLFLLALLIIGLSYKESAKIITAFTVAHSITLALAVVGAVSLPSALVEPMIAASIVYVGLENLLRRPSSRSRWLIAFAFGLIHGLGFASILLEIGIGQGPSILLPLISFNLGVELGQLGVMVLLLPAIHSLRTRPAAMLSLTRAGSVAVVAAGLFWLVNRTVL